MKNQEKEFIAVDIKKIMPSPTGCAVCLGNQEKTFVIYVGPNEGAAILMVLEGIKKSRPLTHDLIGHIFKGFNIHVEHVLINDLKENTFFARMRLVENNDLGKNIIEIDARPSDCIAIAKQQNCPILVHPDVFSEVEDITPLLNKEPDEETDSKDEDFDLFKDSL